jgi:flagellar basal body-associated protein FliL
MAITMIVVVIVIVLVVLVVVVTSFGKGQVIEGLVIQKPGDHIQRQSRLVHGQQVAYSST